MKYKRLSAQKHRQIIRCFCADITATACAEIVGVNRNTVNSWYNEFRHKTRYFWLRLPKRELRAGKTPVFGLLKHGVKVVKMVINWSMEILVPIIQWLILEGSTSQSDG